MSNLLVFEKAIVSVLIVVMVFSPVPTIALTASWRTYVDVTSISNDLSPTGTIIFHVVDASNNTPIEGAIIIVSDNPDLNRTTQSLGYATFQYIPGGFWTFTISAKGYRNQTVEVQVAPDEPARNVDIMLWPIGTGPASIFAGLAEFGIFIVAACLILVIVWFVLHNRDLRKS